MCEGEWRVQPLRKGVGCNQLETSKFLVFKFTKDAKKINCYSQCYLTKTSINLTMPLKSCEKLRVFEFYLM